MLNQNSVFITGGTGLLGSELVSQILKSKPKKVVCLVRDHIPQSRFFQEGMNANTIVVSGDIRDQKLMARILNEYEIDVVYHLAAQTLVQQANRLPSETLDVNINGTIALLDAVRTATFPVKAVVVASSDKAYGNVGTDSKSYDENFPLHGEFPYDVSKSCTDLIAQMYAKSFSLPIIVTRCGNLFGPGDLNFSRLFPSVIEAVVNEKSPVIRSDGKSIRDYLYVRDAADAYLACADAIQKNPALAGEAFNFSYGKKLTVVQMAEHILSSTSIKSIMKSSLTLDVQNTSTNEIREQHLNSDKAKNVLKWTPLVGFEQGIEDTVKWYVNYLNKRLQ